MRIVDDSKLTLAVYAAVGDDNYASSEMFARIPVFLRCPTICYAYVRLRRLRDLFAGAAICLYLSMSKDINTSRRTMMFATKKAIRRAELRRIVPLADTTIYELEQRGEFPRRFYLTARCVVWDLAEVEEWIDQRRRASEASLIKRAPLPDVRQRKTRPVRQ